MSSAVQDSLFNDEGEELTFAKEDGEVSLSDHAALEQNNAPPWKILIVDDEIEIHKVTKLALHDFQFQGKSLMFISAYSGKEAQDLMRTHADIAVVLLDVIMETDDAGLLVVKFIRNVLENQLVRIILRTGQPGLAPENVIVLNYDINDYKSKTELTTQKLFTTLVTALRGFQDLMLLANRQQELEAIASASARFVPLDLLKFLQKDSVVDVKLGDQVQADMTVLFADIRSFSHLSQNLSAQENFHFLNSFFSWIGPVIRQHNGFIDKYVGDGVMALFPNQVEDAIHAAIEMQQQISLYNSHPKNRDFTPIAIGVGLHTGSLILGTIGEGGHMESTIIADTVGLAARMESLSKTYGVSIITSLHTLSHLSEFQKYTYRLIDYIRLKGSPNSIEVVEIYEGDPDHLKIAKTKTKDLFEQAVKHYHQQEVTQAEQIFQQILQLNTQDRAAQVYLERCQLLQQTAQTDLSFADLSLS